MPPASAARGSSAFFSAGGGSTGAGGDPAVSIGRYVAGDALVATDDSVSPLPDRKAKNKPPPPSRSPTLRLTPMIRPVFDDAAGGEISDSLTRRLPGALRLIELVLPLLRADAGTSRRSPHSGQTTLLPAVSLLTS